ncbi:hypothetical protein EV356DRAFT_362324 [Viridothelium virens]|uniref:Uncharacterized protein n=1 Tax=Viridothelium virens TaxID=1048519 RepID=A0A6A6HJ39_VIRVR|nr:hypothetical protein EV356DRAFT_362324 [Viridothelium virens]
MRATIVMDLCNRFQSIFRAMTHGLYMIVDGMAALKPDLKAPAHCAKLAARRFKYCEPEVITKPTSTSEILQYVLIGALLAFAIIFLIELLAARFLYEYVNNGKGANFRRVRRNRAQKQSHKRTASATRQELDDSDEQLYAEALSPNLQLVTESQVFGSRQLSEEQKSHQFMLERPGLFVRGNAPCPMSMTLSSKAFRILYLDGSLIEIGRHRILPIFRHRYDDLGRESHRSLPVSCSVQSIEGSRCLCP